MAWTGIAIDDLLAEELNLREGRCIGVARRTYRLIPVKTERPFAWLGRCRRRAND